MGLFFNNKKSTTTEQVAEERSLLTGALSFNSTSSYISSSAMRLSAVYAACNSISNAVASLPVNIYEIDGNGFKNINYQHQLSTILNKQPSSNLSRFNFFKLIISSVLLKGNGYAAIIRNLKGEITAIRYLHPEQVTPNYNWQTDTITYFVTGFKQPIQSKDILHFWMYSNDLINGVSTISYAVNSLKLATDASNHSQNFYKSGAASSGLLRSGAKLDSAQKAQIRQSWNSAFSDPNSSGIAILPFGCEYQPISINPKDAMLLESRQFDVIEIARFFNISPIKLFDLSKTSYSSLEQTQLSFLEDTINPFLIMLEQELNRKLFNQAEQSINEIQFDRSAMLSTDKQSLAEYYKSMLVN